VVVAASRATRAFVIGFHPAWVSVVG